MMYRVWAGPPPVITEHEIISQTESQVTYYDGEKMRERKRTKKISWHVTKEDAEGFIKEFLTKE